MEGYTAWKVFSSPALHRSVPSDVHEEPLHVNTAELQMRPASFRVTLVMRILSPEAKSEPVVELPSRVMPALTVTAQSCCGLVVTVVSSLEHDVIKRGNSATNVFIVLFIFQCLMIIVQ